jgi:hypothetical protein
VTATIKLSGSCVFCRLCIPIYFVFPNETNNLLRCRGDAERQSCSPIQRRESQPFFFFFQFDGDIMMLTDADMQNAGTVNGVDSFVLSKKKKKSEISSQI